MVINDLQLVLIFSAAHFLCIFGGLTYTESRTGLVNRASIFLVSISLQKTFPFPDFLQVFFDGKQRKDAATGVKSECVSVAVKGPTKEKEKLLGDDMLEKGTGAQVGAAVKAFIDEWQLASKIVGVNYDTCSVNTGRDQGRLRG